MFTLPLLVLGTCGYVVAPPFRLEESMALRPQLLRVRRGAVPRSCSSRSSGSAPLVVLPLATALLVSARAGGAARRAASGASRWRRAPLLAERRGGPAHPWSRSSRLFCSAAQTAEVAPTAAVSSEATLDVQAWLTAHLRSALVDVFGPEYADADPLLVRATKPEFGDYQCNVAMPLGKALKMKPRDIAASLVERLDVDPVFEPVEIAGPGFLNLRLRETFIQEQLRRMVADKARCAVPRAEPGQRVVVDYSSPNIAKEMHVGHLRSTIIGDCVSKVLEFRGHDVLRLNHVGDWGTQFGMLILHLRDQAPDALSGEQELLISDLVAFYKEAKVRFDADEDFQSQARAEVVKLQAGDGESLSAWKLLCDQSERAFREVYSLLDVDERLQTRGESFYNPRLPKVIETLEAASLLQESEGAQCVFVDGYTNRDGEPLPMIVQKSDGGYMY